MCVCVYRICVYMSELKGTKKNKTKEKEKTKYEDHRFSFIEKYYTMLTSNACTAYLLIAA